MPIWLIWSEGCCFTWIMALLLSYSLSLYYLFSFISFSRTFLNYWCLEVNNSSELVAQYNWNLKNYSDYIDLNIFSLCDYSFSFSCLERRSIVTWSYLQCAIWAYSLSDAAFSYFLVFLSFIDYFSSKSIRSYLLCCSPCCFTTSFASFYLYTSAILPFKSNKSSFCFSYVSFKAF